MRISDWSSDVCSSDLTILLAAQIDLSNSLIYNLVIVSGTLLAGIAGGLIGDRVGRRKMIIISSILGFCSAASFMWLINYSPALRSEEHTSEIQSLMRNSYSVFCLQKTISYPL